MGVVILPESDLGRELAKWNKPYVFVPYPKMLYRARRRPDGVVSVGEGDDRILGGQPGIAESFTNGCQKIVRDEAEERAAISDGWANTQQQALERFESKEKAVADVAAHRSYEDRNMSEKAQAEAAVVEASEFAHVPEVTRKRGRPRKAA